MSKADHLSLLSNDWCTSLSPTEAQWKGLFLSDESAQQTGGGRDGVPSGIGCARDLDGRPFEQASAVACQAAHVSTGLH